VIEPFLLNTSFLNYTYVVVNIYWCVKWGAPFAHHLNFILEKYQKLLLHQSM